MWPFTKRKKKHPAVRSLSPRGPNESFAASVAEDAASPLWSWLFSAAGSDGGPSTPGGPTPAGDTGAAWSAPSADWGTSSGGDFGSADAGSGGSACGSSCGGGCGGGGD